MLSSAFRSCILYVGRHLARDYQRGSNGHRGTWKLHGQRRIAGPLLGAST